MQPPSEFSFRTRGRNLETLARETVDVLVVGGGITGAGVAYDAVRRGLSVGLIERRDFAAGTSSRSSKLVHGGLRYLAQGEVGLVREAATERTAIRRIAPHLAQPTPVLVPVHSTAGSLRIRAGLWTYDQLARVPATERHRMIDAAEALSVEPALRPDRLHGAGLYHEYLTDDARLVIEVVKSAAAPGAVIANHAEALGFVVEHGRVAGVTVRDGIDGNEFVARARVVVNAAGPWVDDLRRRAEPNEPPRLHLTKGVHVGVARARLPLANIVVMTARDGRGVFAIPHGDVTYIGTTDTDYPRPDDEPVVTETDVAYLLATANRTFAVEPLVAGDVVTLWAGLRPLLDQPGRAPTELSRRDEIMVGTTGLLSIAGGKLTTFRRMAERVVDLAAAEVVAQGRQPSGVPGACDEHPLVGGETGDDLGAYAARLQRRWTGVDGDVVARLVHLYGSQAERMVEGMGADPALAVRYAPALPLTRAEVEHALREEMALTLEDLLERRARLLPWDPDHGLAAAEPVAAAMATRLDWDRARTDDEVARYRAHVRARHSIAAASCAGVFPEAGRA